VALADVLRIYVYSYRSRVSVYPIVLAEPRQPMIQMSTFPVCKYADQPLIRADECQLRPAMAHYQYLLTTVDRRWVELLDIQLQYQTQWVDWDYHSYPSTE